MTGQWMVRSLRLRLHKTQTEFAAILNKSLPTIQRWEGPVAPAGRNLLELAELAEEHGASEIAETFKELFEQEWGVKLRHCFEGPSIYDVEEDTLP